MVTCRAAGRVPGLCPRPGTPGCCRGLWVLLVAGRARGALPEQGGALPPAAPSPAASLSAFPAPTPVTNIRTDKVEQKSVSLSWQEPGFPTANGTEYEVKYYEKVGSGTGSGPWPCPGRFSCRPALPLGLHPWVPQVPVPLRVHHPPCEGRVVGRGGGACLRTVLLGRFYCHLREREERFKRGPMRSGLLRQCYASSLRKS